MGSNPLGGSSHSIGGWCLSPSKKSKATKVVKNAIKTASKGATQKTAEATGDLIGNEIADKITKASSQNSENIEDISKERYISPEKRQQIIDELRLI